VTLLWQLGAPLSFALPKPGRVDQDIMEHVKLPKGCHHHVVSARTVSCPRFKQRLVTCTAARHNFRSISRGYSSPYSCLLRVAGASAFSTSCDTGISRMSSSWPLASARPSECAPLLLKASLQNSGLTITTTLRMSLVFHVSQHNNHRPILKHALEFGIKTQIVSLSTDHLFAFTRARIAACKSARTCP